MATADERFAILVEDKRRKKREYSSLNLSVLERMQLFESFDDDMNDIYKANSDSIVPKCPYHYRTTIFCDDDEECTYCKSWKYIHALDEDEIKRRHCWWLFWNDNSDAKKQLAEVADVARHYLVFKMNITEELMKITWHPRRFVEWCLDTEEKLEWT